MLNMVFVELTEITYTMRSQGIQPRTRPSNVAWASGPVRMSCIIDQLGMSIRIRTWSRMCASGFDATGKFFDLSI
jgi:hypothetical protein